MSRAHAQPAPHTPPAEAADARASGAVRRTTPDAGPPAGVHHTAVVDPSAHIDPSAHVGPYCVIGPDVRIGPGTILHEHVCVRAMTEMGANNEVFPFAVLGAAPQDLKHRGEETRLCIGDGNTIREHATIHRGTAPGGGATTIGNRCLIMVGAHIAHDCALEDEVILANGVMLAGHCHVEFGATLAGAVAVHHFTTVGTLSFVGGMARIVKDVPPYLVVEGSPAEPRKVNTTALQRRGWAEREVDAVKSAYKALFRGREEPGEREPMRLVVARLREEPGQPEPVLRLCDFLERTASGVHGRWRESLRDDVRR